MAQITQPTIGCLASQAGSQGFRGKSFSHFVGKKELPNTPLILSLLFGRSPHGIWDSLIEQGPTGFFGNWGPFIKVGANDALAQFEPLKCYPSLPCQIRISCIFA